MLDTGTPHLSDQALSLFRQGLAFAAAKDYRRAIELYDGILQLRSDCAEVWYESGLALENLGGYQEAIVRYDRALALQPSSDLACEIWHSRGNAMQYGLGDYKSAIHAYDRALQVKPGDPDIWQNRANALLYGLGSYEEAIANYDRVIFIAPQYSLAWRNRGNALVELRRYQEAITSYDQALIIDPNDQVSSYARTCALNRAGLEEKLPTTNPIWYGKGYSELNPIEEIPLDPELMQLNEAEEDTLTSNLASVMPDLRLPALIIDDAQGRRELSLRQARYTIGRDPKNDLCLYSQYASRHHATLTRMLREDGSFFYQITDGDNQGKRSTNGLIINGRKQQICNLVHEDTVVFGPDVRMTYLFIES